MIEFLCCFYVFLFVSLTRSWYCCISYHIYQQVSIDQVKNSRSHVYLTSLPQPHPPIQSNESNKCNANNASNANKSSESLSQFLSYFPLPPLWLAKIGRMQCCSGVLWSAVCHGRIWRNMSAHGSPRSWWGVYTVQCTVYTQSDSFHWISLLAISEVSSALALPFFVSLPFFG